MLVSEHCETWTLRACIGERACRACCLIDVGSLVLSRLGLLLPAACTARRIHA